MSRLLTLTSIALSVQSGLTTTKVWPNAQRAYDDIEDLYVITGGSGSPGFTVDITPCSNAPLSSTTSGRQSAAEWIRLAYHDMATHDKSNVTGGIDASIQLELDRPQNVGNGMADTLRIFGQHFGAYRSISDLIALGTVLSVKSCGGPSIPMRVGRVDAREPGPATVPEPQQDLASHIAAFDRQGFNQSEMIALVACGHSFGGVHQTDFPTIVANEISSDNTEGVQKFLNQPYYNHSFTNEIATEWIDGTTTNPLVTSFNETMHADQRIFGSDGNATMKAFAKDPSYFASQCAALMERMINTVPKEVTLSDIIVPYPVKPEGFKLTLVNNASMQLEGQLRLFDSDPSTFTNSSVVSATITYKDRYGKSNPDYTFKATNDQGESTSLWGSATLLGINTTIPASTGISSFVVKYSIDDDSEIVTNTNNEHGFPMQDMVIWDYSRSCTAFDFTTFVQTSNIVVAIRNDFGAITSPYVFHTSFSSFRVGDAIASDIVNATYTLEPSSSITSLSNGYTMYNATVTGHTATFFVGATIKGTEYVQSADISTSSLSTCP